MQQKTYILKHFDKAIVSFRLNTSALSGSRIEITHICEEHKAFSPLGLEMNDANLLSWIKSRTIPKNREFVHKVLMELGLRLEDVEGIVAISKSLSLNDCYWIVEKGFEGIFADYNLYDNDFNKTLSLLAYTGYASVKQEGFLSSPEFTTNGMLAKAWRRNPQGRKGTFLYKGGSHGCANCGKEPYSEFYASQVAKAMGLNATAYTLGKWKGKVNSVCALFSSKEFAFIPIYHLVKEGGWEAVLSYYKNLGEEYYEALIEMLIFDVIILNTDRHFGNLGLLVDNSSNKIVSVAPIFDNGLSLFADALDDDLDNIEQYTKTKSMKNAGDFMLFAKKILTKKVKQNIRKLIGFKFDKSSKYKLPNKRLRKIEGYIEKRVAALLTLDEV
ncbi:MAG: XRE family transcriptional regulator [Campylobacterota bacterium]|nr:XRE family transcriptional regulator [Campylobacterota bacterium]